MAAQSTPAGTTPRNVTREELRVCMNSEGELAKRRQGLEARGKKQSEEGAAIRDEAAELQQEMKAAEENSRNTDRVERKVRAHNLRIKAANDVLTALRGDVDQLNKDTNAHNDKCGGISFLPEDKEAILKEREAAAKK